MNIRLSNGAAARRFARVAAVLVAAALAFTINLSAQDFGRGFDFGYGFGYGFGFGHPEFHGFAPGSIVLSGTVYVGDASTVIPGEALPFGCLNTGPIMTPN